MSEPNKRSPLKLVLAFVFMAGWGGIVLVQLLWRIHGPNISWILSVAAAFSAALCAFALEAASHDSRAIAEKRIEQFEIKAAQEPTKTKLAWDVARVTLEAYFERNLSQVKIIFYVAMCVMVVGFLFVLSGISIAYYKPGSITTSYISADSGRCRSVFRADADHSFRAMSISDSEGCRSLIPGVIPIS